MGLVVRNHYASGTFTGVSGQSWNLRPAVGKYGKVFYVEVSCHSTYTPYMRLYREGGAYDDIGTASQSISPARKYIIWGTHPAFVGVGALSGVDNIRDNVIVIDNPCYIMLGHPNLFGQAYHVRWYWIEVI